MWTALAVAALLLGPAQAAESHAGREIAATMSWRGAGWLTRPERAQEEDTDALHRILALKPGQVACDIGAGNGYHSLRMARAVAPGGRVVATDIQVEMLTLLQQRASDAGIDNVEVQLSSETDTKLPPGGCDVVLLVDVYHEFADPGRMLAGIRAALKPDGRAVLVEFRAEDPKSPILPKHRMSKAQIMKEWPAAGFQLVADHNGLPMQHVMAFQPDSGPGPAVVMTPWTPPNAGAPSQP